MFPFSFQVYRFYFKLIAIVFFLQTYMLYLSLYFKIYKKNVYFFV